MVILMMESVWLHDVQTQLYSSLCVFAFVFVLVFVHLQIQSGDGNLDDGEGEVARSANTISITLDDLTLGRTS